MPTLTVLVGMIASGKSTYSKAEARSGAVIVNDDAIVTAIHGGDYALYDKALKPVYKSAEMQIALTALALGRDVIIDRGLSISAQARRRWVALASSLDVPSQAVIFPPASAEEHARRRFEKDSRGHSLDYWIAVTRRHASLWQTPTTDEGFSRVWSMVRTTAEAK